MFLLWKNPGNSVGGHQDMLNSREKKIDGGFNHSISSSCSTSLLKLCAEIQMDQYSVTITDANTERTFNFNALEWNELYINSAPTMVHYMVSTRGVSHSSLE